MGGGDNRVAKRDTGSFHSGGFSADTVLLCVKEECDSPCGKKDVIWGIVMNNTLGIMELHVPVTELDCAAMG